MANSPAIALFRGSPKGNNYPWSPFVIKLEARFRFQGIAYSQEVGTPKTAPRGKIPYITISNQSQGSSNSPEDDTAPTTTTTTLSGSTFIIQSLIKTSTLPDLNSPLTPTQRLQDLSLRALFEEKAYFYGGREKWIDNYEVMHSSVLASVPWPLRRVVGFLAWRNQVATLWGMGVGRLEEEEIGELRREVWRTVDEHLGEVRGSGGGGGRSQGIGEEPFWVLGGKGPSEADAVVFAFIASALVCDAAPTTMKIVRGSNNIVDYAERIHKKYFPEYQKWDL